MGPTLGLIRNETCHMSNSDRSQAFLYLFPPQFCPVLRHCNVSSWIKMQLLALFFPIGSQEFIRKLQKMWLQQKQETVLHPSSQPDGRFESVIQKSKYKLCKKHYFLPVSQKCSWQEMLLLELQWLLQIGVQQWHHLPHPMETTEFININNQ